MDPKELSEYEDMMIGIATSEAVQFGRDISQIVTRHRGRRRGPMNRYECQVYCEKLLIRVHDLLEPASRGGERNLTTLLNEIEKNPSSFLTLHKAASYLMWSESHFARKFKERTGSSFIHYVTAKRLERAKFVLIHTDKPVLRIAAELDFTSLNYFSRQFKKHIKVTPSHFPALRKVDYVVPDTRSCGVGDAAALPWHTAGGGDPHIRAHRDVRWVTSRPRDFHARSIRAILAPAGRRTRFHLAD